MTAIASRYYSKLPEKLDDSYTLLIDPMLATGGSAVEALTLLQVPARDTCASSASSLHRKDRHGRTASPERVDLHAGRRRTTQRAQISCPASATSAIVSTARCDSGAARRVER